MSTTSPNAGTDEIRSSPLLDKPSYKGYVVAVLVLGYIFNVIDRGALGILVEPIRQELRVSDTLMGLLTGLAFAVFFGPSFAVAQTVATVRMRAVSTSVLLFVQTIIGLTAGPFLVGVVSDLLSATSGDDSLRIALVIVGLANIWAALHYLLGSRHYREDIAETQRLNALAYESG